MNKLEIIITEKAQNDIIQIKKFIAENNKNASKDFVKKLRKAFVNLSFYPGIGKRRPELSGNYEILFLPFMTNYLIVYSVSGGKLYIVRFLSNYRNICSIL